MKQVQFPRWRENLDVGHESTFHFNFYRVHLIRTKKDGLFLVLHNPEAALRRTSVWFIWLHKHMWTIQSEYYGGDHIRDQRQ